MKKRFITCLMLVSILGAGMTGVTSCSDYDNDIRHLQEQIDNHTKLIDALQIQANNIEKTVKDLQDRLDNYKPCGCEAVNVDVMKVINEYIANSGKFKNFDDLMDAIKKAGTGTSTGDGNCDGNCGLTEDDVKAIINNYININNLQEAITILQEALKNYYTKEEIDEKLIIINNAISEVNGRVDNIDLQIIDINTDLTKIKETADKALQQSQENLEMIKLLQQALEDLDIPVGDSSSLSKRIEDLEKALKESYYTKTEVDVLIAQVLEDAEKYTDDEISKLRQDIEEKIDDLQDDLDKLKTRVTTLETTVAQQTKDINSLFYNQNHLITSIELQGSKNPAFGRYALPDGTSSNVLIAYYGKTKNPVYFPAIDDAGLAAVCANSQNWITAEDYDALGFQPLYFNGTLIGDEGNAGKLYLTVNPSNVDFTGANFKLVNSLGEEGPVILGDLKPCNEKLSFGFGRATATSNPVNGLYEATATIEEDRVDEAKMVIDDQLIDALKSVYKNKLNASVSQLASAIYKQFNGFLDAYGVQGEYKYKENDADGNPIEKTAKVTSRYNIAASAFTPLSYNANFPNLGKLPIITPLSERNIDLNNYIKVPKFDFDFGAINTDNYNVKVEVHFSDLWVESDGSIWTNAYMTSYVSSNGEIATSYDKKVEEKFCLVSADGTFNGNIYDFEGGINPGAAAGLSPEQINAINSMIALIVEDRSQVWSAQLQEGFEKQLTAKLKDLVNDVNTLIANVSNNVQGQLDSAIKDMIGNLNNALNSQLSSIDKLINQLNDLSDRVNNKLNNLSDLIQASLAIEAADGSISRVSTSKRMPSFVGGNGEAIKLYTTSLTGEIAAPAYMKYVAVTNIYQGEKNAHQDASLKAALKSTNDTKCLMNTIFNGDQHAVIFKPAVKGALYEIVYSALDYTGKISQRKYYIYVKN